MKIAIHHGGKNGFVFYDDSNKEVMVTHPDEKVREGVRHYLTNERGFITTGLSGKIGDRMTIAHKPNERKDLMEMALCEMKNSIGIDVNWDHPDNWGGTASDYFRDARDPNATADKPIVKGLDGNTFEIIN